MNGIRENVQEKKPTLVLGGTGKTGRRVVARLMARGMPVRVGSRSGQPPFDWENRATWEEALDGVGAVYISYYPDLAIPGAVEAVGSFARLAVANGVRRLVLLAGQGESEAEQAMRESGAELTILRSTWFSQNFSEDYMLPHVLSGEVALPAGNTPEPFVDAEDIADVAVAALTDDRHVGQLYELTGPRLLTFAQANATRTPHTGHHVALTALVLPDGVERSGDGLYPRGAAERRQHVDEVRRGKQSGVQPPRTRHHGTGMSHETRK